MHAISATSIFEDWPSKADIAEGGILQKPAPTVGLSLTFRAGERPGASDIEHFLHSDSGSSLGASIAHRSDDAAGWVEILASGLAFDLVGLAPAQSSEPPEAKFCFGISRKDAEVTCEAITLLPGPHLQGGGSAMIPVVRTMAGLAANFALHLPVTAVCWHPAGTWMEPEYFARTIESWLSGGAFPALGLTGIEQVGEEAIRSTGLAFFTGQEVELERRGHEPSAETVKLAIRVIDYLVGEGPLDAVTELHGPSGELLIAEPSGDRRLVKVWREA